MLTVQTVLLNNRDARALSLSARAFTSADVNVIRG
jgi:hypothetical protein